MREVVIVSAVRTPIGKWGGSLTSVNPEDLADLVIRNALERIDLPKESVEYVVMGHVRSTSRANNIARVSALKAGLPIHTPAFTVNMLCGSGMQAINLAMREIMLGSADVAVAVGTENMSQSIFYLRNIRNSDLPPELVDANLEGGPGSQPIDMYGKDLGMGQTAENVAERYGISRVEQDAFALESQRRAELAIENGRFQDEIVPVEVKQKKQTVTFAVDEFPRATTLETLASLRPAFKPDGTVTAGNSCGRNDGAAAVVLMSAEKAKELGMKPLARIVTFAAAGVEPEYMGIGPVPATLKALSNAGLTVNDIGLVELNEAFASQSIACMRELKLNPDEVNVNGGAIALGHPLGCTGTRLVVSLAHEMGKRGTRYGLATQCVGGGQGVAMILERFTV